MILRARAKMTSKFVNRYLRYNTQTKARIENQRTLDMFVISKNIINDSGEINMTITM